MLQSYVTVTTISTVRSLDEIHDVEICTINTENKMKVCESEVGPKEMIPFSIFLLPRNYFLANKHQD
jgi:hypothetical protein